ncbi:MAG: hypothetical protein HOP07_17000 [Bacteriovoracaceae bacterium]|nr:hypothetical protein [Bacteriovoracaceae bacterium]
MGQYFDTIYYCSECKRVVKSLEDLLFIEEFSHKGFCTESCIEDFYLPLIRYFEVLENKLRLKHNLINEFLGHEVSESVFEDIISKPDEVYKKSNELNESFYSFIKNYGEKSIVVIASIYNFEPSFIFLTLQTSSAQLINEFRYDENVTLWYLQSTQNINQTSHEDVMGQGEVMSSEDTDADLLFMQHLESKKSKILAEILMNRKDDDISFEDYTDYDFCFQETLDLPDEVFEYKDNEGDIIFFYLKSFNSGLNLSSSYTYIIIAIKQKNDQDQVNVYPVLAVPTTDMELCQEFRKGIRLTGALKN